MKTIRFHITSDNHLGLKTDDIDRTDEIIKILIGTIKRAVKSKKEGYQTVLIILGDLFNSNVISDKIFAEFLRVLNLIKKHDIETKFVVGNHEAVADPDRLSCLDFIKRIKVGYPSITLIEDISFIPLGVTDNGPLFTTYLPHVSRALVQKKLNSGKLKKEVSPQEYIETRCRKIMEKVGKNAQHIVFSHLDVIGAHGGSEETLLRKSGVYLPKCFTNPPLGWPKPEIYQAHIHTQQDIDNIHIIGSPIYCSFGEKGDKYEAQVTVSNQIGQPIDYQLFRTAARPFLQLEVDMIEEEGSFIGRDEVQDFLADHVENSDREPIIKFDVTIDPEHNSHDWKEIRFQLIKDYKCYVKPIVPRVIAKRTVRSAKQKINLEPKQAVQVFLKARLKKEPKRMKRVYARMQKYLEV